MVGIELLSFITLAIDKSGLARCGFIVAALFKVFPYDDSAPRDCVGALRLGVAQRHSLFLSIGI